MWRPPSFSIHRRQILDLRARGLTIGAIADALIKQGVHSPYFNAQPERYQNARYERARITGLVRHYVEKATPPRPLTLRQRRVKRAFEYWRASRRYAIVYQPNGRVIDMGGRRDHWHIWTPQMQAAEFNANCGPSPRMTRPAASAYY